MEIKNYKYILIALILSFFVNWSYSQNLFTSEPNVRVRIVNNLKELKISFNNQWQVLSGSDEHIFLNEDVLLNIDNNSIIIHNSHNQSITCTNQIILTSFADTGTISIADIPYGVGWWWEGKEDRIYEGIISIYVNKEKSFEVVVNLPLEEYLKGVVPYEIGGDSPLESLKAQAVAARSEAVIALNSKMYSGEHYDLTSDVECQVFSGNKKRTCASDSAVVQTRGMILTENGLPINAYYASNCGGHSELIGNVWPERPDPDSYRIALNDNVERKNLDISDESSVRDWIFSQPDVYCNPNLETELPAWSQKNFRWKKEFKAENISKMISGEKNLGNLINIKPLKRGKSGRMYLARFIFEKDSFEVKGELAIRQLWQPALRSACFVIDKLENNFILHGAGWGHGVGMCQSGAVAQAILGKDYKSILKHYYQKADLISLY